MRAFLILLLAPATTSASPITHELSNDGDADKRNNNWAITRSSNSVTSTLTRRWDGSPAMGQELQTARNKGCTLWEQMHADDAQAGSFFSPPRESAHSDYLELSDLSAWGYVVKKTSIKRPKCDVGNGKDGYGLQAVLQAKGIATDKKAWKCVKITHGDPTSKALPEIDLQSYPAPGGRNLRATGAIYQFAINAQDGVLVIAKQYSPAFQASYRRPPVPTDELPALRSSSDIAWLAWKPFADKGAKLNHIVTWSVTNRASARLIAAALELAADETETVPDTDPKPYPWKEFDAEQASGALILAKCSPNGVGIGYMLAQHKPELGNRLLKKIEAFTADTGASGIREVSLWWQLEDSVTHTEIPSEG